MYIYEMLRSPKTQKMWSPPNSTCLNWFFSWVFITQTQIIKNLSLSYGNWKHNLYVFKLWVMGFQLTPPLNAKIWVIEKIYAPRYETKQVIFRVREKVELEKWVMEIEFDLWVMLNSNKLSINQIVCFFFFLFF